MDELDTKILDLLKGNARMTYQELGNKLGMSRVAAKKRVKKLEEAGIIRGYNTTIYLDEEATMIMDIETTLAGFDAVLEYLGKHTAFIRQIYTTTMPCHIHAVAAGSTRDLKYLQTMIQKKCGEHIVEHGFTCHAVRDIVKDVYGGVRYDDWKRKVSEDEGDIQQC